VFILSIHSALDWCDRNPDAVSFSNGGDLEKVVNKTEKNDKCIITSDLWFFKILDFG
jgi:hypothetical protein